MRDDFGRFDVGVVVDGGGRVLLVYEDALVDDLGAANVLRLCKAIPSLASPVALACLPFGVHPLS